MLWGNKRPRGAPAGGPGEKTHMKRRVDRTTRRRSERKLDVVDSDLTATRVYLRRLARAMLEAAFSPDPRLIRLGIRLATFQGEARGDR